jgi:tetratricopeptide (TPR) repeat protein
LLTPAAADPLAVPTVRETAGRRVDLRPVPTPDLSQAEPAVKQTLGEARQNLVTALEAPGITDRELADAFGATGGFYLAYRLWEAAEPCYANAAALAPDDYRWPYYLGYRFAQDSRLEQAVGGYERALALRPDYLPARVRLGLAYLELGRPEKADALFQQALADPGLRPSALFGLGQAAFARGDAAAAVQRFEAALAESPDASRIHYPLAMAYRSLGQVDEARTHLGQRGDGEPKVPDPLVDELSGLLKGTRTLYYRGIEAVRNGQFDVGVAAFSEALTREPENVNARVTLARARYLTGDRQAARRELDEALSRKPDHDLGLFLRGVLADEDGEPAVAVDYYRRAVQAAPDHAGAHHYLGNALMRDGRYREAADHYGAAVRALPKNMTARLMEALALVRAGDHGVARERLEVAVVEIPDDSMLRMALARLLAASPDDRVRDGARALPIAQDLFDGFGSLENAETLAMALAEAGRPEDAAALQENAVKAVAAAGRFESLPRLEEDLGHYRQGQPCRRPWSAFDPTFAPPPAVGRGPFLDYPTLSAY